MSYKQPHFGGSKSDISWSLIFVDMSWPRKIPRCRWSWATDPRKPQRLEFLATFWRDRWGQNQDWLKVFLWSSSNPPITTPSLLPQGILSRRWEFSGLRRQNGDLRHALEWGASSVEGGGHSASEEASPSQHTDCPAGLLSPAVAAASSEKVLSGGCSASDAHCPDNGGPRLWGQLSS